MSAFVTFSIILSLNQLSARGHTEDTDLGRLSFYNNQPTRIFRGRVGPQDTVVRRLRIIQQQTEDDKGQLDKV